MFFNILAALILIFFQDFFYNLLLGGNGSFEIFKLIGLIAVLQIISNLPLTLIMGLGEFKKYSIRMVICNFIILVVILSCVLSFQVKTTGAIIGLLIALVLNSLFTWAILLPILRKYKVRFSLNNLFTETRDILKEGFIYYVGNTLITAVANILLIGLFTKYIGIEEYGFLRIAGSLIAILNVIPLALKPVTITFLAGEHTENEMRLKSIQLRYITMFTFVISIVLLLFINPIVIILFGDKYVDGIPIFIFLILSQVMILVSSLLSNFLVAKGFTTYIGVVSSLGALTYIFICFAAIPRYGIYGYFLAYIIGYGLGFGFLIFKEFNLYNYVDKLYLIRLIVMILVSCSVILPLLSQNNLLISSIAVVIFLFTFSLLFVNFVMLKTEKLKFISLLRKMI